MSDLDELLDRWEDAREDGRPISAEELCADHPDLLEPLQKRVAALLEIDERLRDMSHVGETDSAIDKRERPTFERLQIAPEFADFRFHKRGGLGAVYVARDVKMHRDVAVKFIHRERARDAESRVQFMVEAEVTARLEHPGIIPVLGWGEDGDRRLFYVMRFIQGENFDDAIQRYHDRRRDKVDQSELNVEFCQLLGCFVSACKTIAFAHNRGIIHRDIKPQNILFGRYGETLVADWGLMHGEPRLLDGVLTIPPEEFPRESFDPC